mmetsp:Transcript_3924/g.8243  ORF Transcript_3924/g.8243 Transcript_3924/m.8243 type:complete len:430 (-) Transcript_3924:45-1334(-)
MSFFDCAPPPWPTASSRLAAYYSSVLSMRNPYRPRPAEFLWRDCAVLAVMCETLGKSLEWLMDGQGNDASKWRGVNVRAGRVVGVCWKGQGLTGVIPPEVGELTALTYLSLGGNDIGGAIPPEVGTITTLTALRFENCNLSSIPSTLSNLKALRVLNLEGNRRELVDAPTPLYLQHPKEVQQYLGFMHRSSVLPFLKEDPPAGKLADHPLFKFLAADVDATEHMFSFLDPLHCSSRDRISLLRCWNSLGGAEDDLRHGFGDDVARWKGVVVEDGRVVRINWSKMELDKVIPPAIGALDELRSLNLLENSICGGIPSEIGNLTRLEHLFLGDNPLVDGELPSSIGKLVNLERLHLHNMSLKGQVPKSLCNLVKLEELKACGNELTNAPPSLMVGRHGYRKTSRSDNCLPLYLACLRAGVPYPSTPLHLYA